jgi:hypothetical protein
MPHDPDAATRYKQLHQFLGTQFIQDPEDDRPLDSIVADYLGYRTADAEGLRGDIARFIAAHDNDLEEAFERMFAPQVDPAGFDMTLRAWLEEIASLAAERPRRQ